jgi:hypothetical protein
MTTGPEDLRFSFEDAFDAVSAGSRSSVNAKAYAIIEDKILQFVLTGQGDDDVVRFSKCIPKLYRLLEIYNERGSEAGAPLSTSCALLLCHCLLYLIDKRVVTLPWSHGLLSKFHPAIDISVFSKLVLVQGSYWQVCHKLETYFREREVNSTHSVYDDDRLSASFFNAEQTYQEHLTTCLDHDKKQRLRNKKELERIIEEYRYGDCPVLYLLSCTT